MNFLERFINGSKLEKAFVLMIVGMAGVFIVIALIYIMVKLLIKLFPGKD